MTPEDKIEWLACAESPLYFARHYAWIYDAEEADWIPFGLWPAQARTLKTIQQNRLTIILKARQLGLTWLCLSYALWSMLFHPKAEVLLFSRRDDEAVYLLDDRLKGMYNRLPVWMRAKAVASSSGHEFALSNGSTARAFPTSAGDSYTATLAIVDEADLLPDFNRLMRAVKPTIDTGGRMILLSRADKTQPNSEFKRIYRAAKRGGSPWAHVFLPWSVRPARDGLWYAAQEADIMSRTGALDDLHEQYPATDIESLSPRSLDKRIPARWITDCFIELEPIKDANAPAYDQLRIYKAPVPGRLYVLGADPAEGNPTSDDSALSVTDVLKGEEMAVCAGKFQPSTFAAMVDEIGMYYNQAGVMVERNNHGHAVIMWLEEHSTLELLPGRDDKPGWLSNKLGKTLLYNGIADSFRDKATILHSFDTYTQLSSIEGSTLLAPPGEHDDRADAFALAEAGRAAMLEPARAGMRQGKIKGQGGASDVRKAHRRVKH
jgi:hypothetical protein